MSRKLMNVKIKSNASFNMVILIAFIIHTITYFHIKYMRKPNPSSGRSQSVFSITAFFNHNVNAESLFRFELKFYVA